MHAGIESNAFSVARTIFFGQVVEVGHDARRLPIDGHLGEPWEEIPGGIELRLSVN